MKISRETEEIIEMNRTDLEDEVMSLRAQVKVLQLWNKKAKARLETVAKDYRSRDAGYMASYVEEIL